MEKNELKQKYDKLVAEIESAKMFDGRGKGVDVYVCEKCAKQFYTRYKDKGVTPFTIRCRRDACAATMIHRITISEAQAKNDGLVVHNWVRPTFEQFLKLNEGAQEHVLNGGLMLEDELAQKIDMAQPNLSNLIIGNRKITVSLAKKIGEVLDIDPMVIMQNRLCEEIK